MEQQLEFDFIKPVTIQAWVFQNGTKYPYFQEVEPIVEVSQTSLVNEIV